MRFSELFDSLFKSKKKINLKQKIRDTQREVEKEYKPEGEIAYSIVHASNNCLEAVKPLIDVSDENERKLLEMRIFCEFIYFFMHVTIRTATSKLNSNQVKTLMAFIGPNISQTAINSYIQHWPEEYKVKATSEFYDNLNKAELEYSKAKELHSKNAPFDRNSLFSMLAHNISDLFGGSRATVTLAVLESSVKEFTTMHLNENIESASKVK